VPVCARCGASSSPAESCPACGAWGTLVGDDAPVMLAASTALALEHDEIRSARQRRVGTGLEPWDDALGGGLVVPSVVLIYGEGGAGKTTAAGTIAQHVATFLRGQALYLSAERPTDQARDAVRRVCPDVGRVAFAGVERGSRSLAACIVEVKRRAPRLVVWDSAQAFDAPGHEPGSDGAIKAVVRAVTELSASLRHVALIVSQVNAEGRPAGPHRPFHDVSAVVQLTHDVVKVTKNWHGPAPRSARLRPEEIRPVVPDPAAPQRP
jgi:predicted ATP-dependent serine protease